MKTSIITGILVLSTLVAASRKPKIRVKEASKCKISQESIQSGAPTVALENGSGCTLESFELCMKTSHGMECFSQSGSTVQKGAKDNLKLLQPGQKFCIKKVMVKDNATGKMKKLCGKKYKVV